MNKYHITLLYDRGECGELGFEIEYPKLPNPKQWEEETIGDEVYWKIETLQGIIFARKTFIYGIKIEKTEVIK